MKPTFSFGRLGSAAAAAAFELPPVGVLVVSSLLLQAAAVRARTANETAAALRRHDRLEVRPAVDSSDIALLHFLDGSGDDG